MAETQSSRLRGFGERPARGAASPNSSGDPTLYCQWCSVDLAPGETVCPDCGSPGIDPSMTRPGATEAGVIPAVAAQKVDEELVEWWNEAGGEEEYRNSSSIEQDQTPVFLGLIGTAVICVILGVFVAPTFLTPIFENNLGVTVEKSSDLRPLGGLLGLLTGAFIGAIGIWVSAPRS